jgi:type VI protein secretion system component Hcp
MLYEGIEGESEVRGKSGRIELFSLQFGAARSIAAAKGGARGQTDVEMREITVNRNADSISALLFLEAISGKFDRKVEIDFVRTGPNNQPITDLALVLENCGISALEFAGGGASKPVETIRLNFTKITMKSFKIGDALNAVPFTGAFDLITGKPA